MRFTTSKETRNPHTDFVGRIVQGLLIVIKERVEMFSQFSGNDIFTQFLLDALFIILGNFDNAVYVTIDI